MLQQQEPLEPFVSAKEIGEILGLSTRTVLKNAERHGLPGYRVGGLWRFRMSEVLAWVEKHRNEAEA